MEPPEEEPFFFGDHYLYDEQWYFHKFPVEWAKTHIRHTGPKECMNCARNGTLHDRTVFVGYCTTCAEHAYRWTRGHGFDGDGQEKHLLRSDSPSAFASYLRDVNVDDIPPLLCTMVVEDEDRDEDDRRKSCYVEPGILDCHLEGGYNDY